MPPVLGSCGDAVLTREYLKRGQPYEGIYDPSRANQSMSDVLDVGDQIIPEHDDSLIQPVRR